MWLAWNLKVHSLPPIKLTASISGGDENTAGGYFASACGGFGNQAYGFGASISGGGHNYVRGTGSLGDYGSSISGGYVLYLSGDYRWAAGDVVSTQPPPQ